ncbi:MAG TPA: helicase C-terminal domain-containing protein [bacterium]|nr:helicase C-terminal domain-containing protein [bacterium]
MAGTVNDNGLICDLRRISMGNSFSVPAVIAAASPGEILIHNHPGGDVRPSIPDLDVAARAAEKGVGSYIVDNNILTVFPVVERIIPDSDEIENINPDEVTAILGENGNLKKALPSYEFRLPQIKMALEVTDSVNSNNILVAEAGTGTGKSFAYLIPAMLYVSKNKGKKGVISTSTIALEEQLFEKDIPFLLNKLNFNDITVAILKGRSNYLCKRKYSLFRMESLQTKIIEKEDSRMEAVREIDVWMNQVNDGTKSSMNNALANDVWSEICAEEFTCEKSKCRYFNTCFFFKARRKANFASLILINHHLLMADVSMKMEGEEEVGLLPKFDILVIDEAHNLFKSAISFLGESVSTQSVVKQLNRLYFPKRGTGLLTKMLDNYADKEVAGSFEKAVNRLSAFIPMFAHSIVPEVIEVLGKDSEDLYELDNIKIRNDILHVLEKAVAAIVEITGLVEPALKKIKAVNTSTETLRTINDDLVMSLITDTEGTVLKLKGYAEFLSDFCISKDTVSKVFWGEKDKNQIVTLTMTPIEIQTILAKRLYDVTSCVILTSATLSTGKNEDGFSFFNRESGLVLTNREKKYVNLASCFDYSSQVRAFICTDMPSPVDNKELFDTESVRASREIVKASNGGALVLFTSIGHREQAAKYLVDLDFNVICQGKYAISKIVKDFRDDKNATLLATDTFWEGIDMKGETLRNLVIMKLPFRFPSHPFIKRYVAKLEADTGQGGFAVYTLPNALLKFKQGFGRLIRTKDDVGTVTILDKRMIEKYYGREFIKAAPDGVKFFTLPSGQVAEKIKEFFGK